MVKNTQEDNNIKYLEDRDDHRIPYIDIGKKVHELTAKEFKDTFRGPYFDQFKKVRDNHNLYLNVKNVGRLLKLAKKMNYYGVIYQITQIRDENGDLINEGPTWYFKSRAYQNGFHRIGKTITYMKRIMNYKSNVRNLPFENLYQKFLSEGIAARSFKVRLIAVCRTKNELDITEIFYQLYFNRENSRRGTNLDINKFFNTLFGDKYPTFEQYKIPKWEIVKFLLQNKNKKFIVKYYGNKYNVGEIHIDTLNSRLEKYFGTKDIDQIKLDLLRPYLDRCMRMGLDLSRALKYLKDSGFEYYTGYSYPETKLNRHVKDLYRHIKLEARSAYESVRRIFFTYPFANYLRSLGVDNFLSDDIVKDLEIVRNKQGKTIGQIYEIEIKEWSIVEHLVARNVPNIEIAIILGLCKESDSNDVRNKARKLIKDYLQIRWRIPVRDSQFKKYTVANLKLFLKTMYIGKQLYSQYLNLNL